MDLPSYGRSRAAYSVWFVMAVFLLLPSLDAQEPLTIDVLAASRALWPREVTVNVAHEVPLLVNGKVSGSMQASPGRVYPIRSIEPDRVVVDAMGSSLTFPPPDTDILVGRKRLGLDSKRSRRRAPQQHQQQTNPHPEQFLARLRPHQRTRLSIDSLESSCSGMGASWSDSTRRPSKPRNTWPSTSLHRGVVLAGNSPHGSLIGKAAAESGT